ncbi:tachylectin-related carbohydrate-binding protein [Lentzea sp. NPDC004782]|uniref:tachylectin-related carbohydrate-binding protein n=1 Tax=Lentzea sp. NPDC004782 TaxID=3154458 RepID=UPI00339EC97C
MAISHARRTVSVLLSAALATSALTIAQSAPTAVAAETIQCRATSAIYAGLPDKYFRSYLHAEPETGAAAWDPMQPGAAVIDATMIAGPDGAIYTVHDGKLEKRHWNGSGFDNNATPEIIPVPWTSWNNTPARFRISIDAKGDFYQVADNGNLIWARYDAAAKKWDERVLDTGWNRFDQVFTSGEGVIWARNPDEMNGRLYRYVYHADSQRWLGPAKADGSGWNMYHRLIGVGADVIYGFTKDGIGWEDHSPSSEPNQIVWYRYTAETNTWQGGKYLGWGWSPAWKLIGAPDSCKWVGGTVPQRPVVSEGSDRAGSLVQTADGRVHHLWVDPQGGLIHAKQRDLVDPTATDLYTVPQSQNLTGGASLTTQEDGRLFGIGTGTNSSILSTLQPTKDALFPVGRDFGGFTASSPTVVKGKDNLLSAFIVDTNGEIWARGQQTVNTDLRPWTKGYTTFPGTTPGPTPKFAARAVTAVADNGAIVVIATDLNGQPWVANYYGNGNFIGGWTALGQPTGTTLASAASATLTRDGTVQLAARGTDGRVYTKRQGTDGSWTGAWTKIQDRTFLGQPSILTTTGGTTYVVAHGTDKYIYETGTTTPGGAIYRSWNMVRGSEFPEPSDTDAGVVAMSNGNWVLSYRNEFGELLVAYATTSGSSSVAARSASAEDPTAKAPSFTVKKNKR